MVRTTLTATLLGFGIALGALALAGVGAGLFHLPVGPTAALLTGVALFVLALGKRTGLTMATALTAVFALVPILLGGSAWAIGRLAEVAHWRCGTGDIAIPFVAAIGVLTLAALSFPFTLMATVFLRRLRRAAVTTVAMLVVGGVTAAAGLVSLRRPSPDAFLDLFERMTLEPGGSITVAGASFEYVDDVKPASLLGERHCLVVTTMPDGTKKETRVETFDTCPRLHLHHDKTSGFFLVTDTDDNTEVRSIIHATYAPSVLALADLSSARLGAPRGWVFGALIGLILATVAAAAASATMRRARRELAGSQEAEHTGSGWLAMAGPSAPRFVPELATVAPGPVLVREHDVRLPTYRDDGSSRSFTLTVGSRDTVLAAASSRATAWLSVAMMIAVSTSAPLWVARLYGLL